MDLIKYIILCIVRDSNLNNKDNKKIEINQFKNKHVKSGEELEIVVKGQTLKKENLYVYCLDDTGMVDNSEIEYSIKDLQEKQVITFKFNNKNNKEKLYKLNVKYEDGKSSKANSMSTVYVMPDIKKNNVVVNEIKPKISHMKEIGGRNPITVKGNNLISNDLELKVIENSSNRQLTNGENNFKGNSNQQEIFFDFPKNNTDIDKVYRVEVWSKNENKLLNSSNVIVRKRKVTNISETLKCTQISKDNNGKIITIKFNENVKGDIQTLRRNIKLARTYNNYNNVHANFELLDPKDNIEIKNNEIIITLNKALTETEVNNRIKIEAGAVKDSNEKFNKEILERIMADNEINQTEYKGMNKINSKIFNSNGGNVEIEIIGKNLKQFKKDGHMTEGTVVQIFDVTSTTAREDIKVYVEGYGDNQLLKFKVPENNTEKTQTYMVSISTNGGVTRVEENKNFEDERFNRIAISVLPKNKNKNDITISHITIASYGTNTDQLGDNTIATTPLNQESKKTRLEVYGTNLDKNKTKVRVVDKNGVIWPVVNEPSYDSTDVFIMVGFDKTGVMLGGTHQMLEVICPNNIKGDPEFKIEVAPDGINFDKKTFARVKVPSYKVANREMKVENVTIKYLNEKGDQLEKQETVKAYDWFFKKEFKFNQKEIKGYTLKEIKKDPGSIKDENKVVTYIYSQN
ncbi:MucBP domain-containing protein [Hathewaya limosa]|uniref:MucBP domain-containing protein n=1 Tax=Hathewaya limosa TaxID=1536 RepID=A0ABU0JX84_HATLI|nr:MucBP domain-containing protein [Hathewaya limosa]MDQ0480773.1 hypothetical protein [Hathewaya limosa]